MSKFHLGKLQFKKIAVTLAFFAAALIVIGIAGYLSWLNHDEFEKAMVEQAQTQLLIITESEAQSVEKYISDIEQELSALSMNSSIHKILKERPNEASEDLKYYSCLKDAYLDIENLIDSLYLIDAAGRIWDVGAQDPRSKAVDITQIPDAEAALIKQQKFISSVFRTAEGKQVIAILQPIFENKVFIGSLRALISIERLNALFRHINKENKYYALLMDNSATIISSPETNYIGISISAYLSENLVFGDLRKVESIISTIKRGEEGSFIDEFYIKAGEKPKAKFLVAYVPIRIGGEPWCLFVGLNYNVIGTPINKHLMENLLYAGFMFLVFLILGIAFYMSKRKGIELEITKITTDIINKQLHIEIEESKKLEKELKEALGLIRKKEGPSA